MTPVLCGIAAFLAVMNLLSFCLMRHDKLAARRGARRVPEKTLFLVTGLFGGLGGVLGMKIMHHKTKHWYFALFFPLMLAAQLGILGYLFLTFCL